MKETIDTIIAWHRETFPDATLERQLKKYTEEFWEFMEANHSNDLPELADMVIVCGGIMRFSRVLGGAFLQTTYTICWNNGGYDMTELWDAVEKKMEINKKRKWQKSNGLYHHIEKGDKND